MGPVLSNQIQNGYVCSTSLDLEVITTEIRLSGDSELGLAKTLSHLFVVSCNRTIFSLTMTEDLPRKSCLWITLVLQVSLCNSLLSRRKAHVAASSRRRLHKNKCSQLHTGQSKDKMEPAAEVAPHISIRAMEHAHSVQCLFSSKLGLHHFYL